MRSKLSAAGVAALSLCLGLPAQSVKKSSFEVKGEPAWLDTNLDVKPGELVTFEAEGTVEFADASSPATPDGLKRGWTDMIRPMPVNSAGRGALIGKVGENAAARAFLIGPKLQVRAPIAGRLFLGINRPSGPAPTGAFKVKIVIDTKPAEEAKSYTGPIPKLTEEQWEQIPLRVVDPAGTPGDRVNFLIFGEEEQVKEALLSQHWVIVDKDVKSSILRGAIGALSQEAYLSMPMSELRVFDRGQDYGFAQSDPIRTVAERHHFRIWKAPFTADGWTVFVGAGTHDVGFDKDQRNNSVTHKIDPDTDKEREYIGDSLRHSGQVVKTDYYTPKDTITKAKTAHGQEFFSDGRILLIYLRPPAAKPEGTSKSPADEKPAKWADGWDKK